MKRRMIQIDSDRFRIALRNRRLKAEKLSVELGYSSPYLSLCATRGRISEATAIMLDEKYGIKRHEYMIAKEKTVSIKDFDCETVSSLIKEAAKHFDCTEWQAVPKVLGAMTEKNRAEALATQTAIGIEYNALLFHMIMKK